MEAKKKYYYDSERYRRYKISLPKELYFALKKCCDEDGYELKAKVFQLIKKYIIKKGIPIEGDKDWKKGLQEYLVEMEKEDAIKSQVRLERRKKRILEMEFVREARQKEKDKIALEEEQKTIAFSKTMTVNENCELVPKNPEEPIKINEEKMELKEFKQEELTISTEGKPQEGMSSSSIAVEEVAEKIIEPEPKKEAPINKPIRKRMFS